MPQPLAVPAIAANLFEFISDEWSQQGSILFHPLDSPQHASIVAICKTLHQNLFVRKDEMWLERKAEVAASQFDNLSQFIDGILERKQPGRRRFADRPAVLRDGIPGRAHLLGPGAAGTGIERRTRRRL